MKLQSLSQMIFFSRTTGPNSTKHCTKHPWVERIHVCSNKGPHPFQRVDNYEIANTLTDFENLLLQNHWTNFNQTWHKASLKKGEGNSSLFQRKATRYKQGGDNYEMVKIHCRNFENNLLQNQWANFNQTWHKASLGKRDSILFK